MKEINGCMKCNLKISPKEGDKLYIINDTYYFCDQCGTKLQKILDIEMNIVVQKFINIKE